MLQVLEQTSARARRRRGLNLLEVLVVTALMSAISLFTMVLYNAALGDFEHANSKLSMNTYARRAAAKVNAILSTASARRPGTPVPEAIYFPEETNGTNEFDTVDFISTANFVKLTSTEVSYAFDRGGTTPPGYTPLFRYRLGWTSVPFGNIPRNSVYLERLNLDPNTFGTTTGGGTPAIASGSPLGYRQVVATNIARCTFKRTFAGTMQVRILVYSYDSTTGRGIDGTVMRSQTRRQRTDATGANDVKSYELLTSVPLPTINIK